MLRLDLVAARRWALTARSGLADARDRINALNVFPVPDGDTGTNMYLTLDGAIEVLRAQLVARGQEVTLRDGLALLARGTLLAARGNSGVILSQLSRGLHEAIEDRLPQDSSADIDEVDAATLAQAFDRADHLAWEGVTSPVEGTILSVSRAAKVGAAKAADAPGARAYDVAAAAVSAATAALQHTPQQLPVLARAGVVDAGGAGYLILIEALEKVLSGRQPEPGEAQVPDWLERRARPLDTLEDGGRPGGEPGGAAAPVGGAAPSCAEDTAAAGSYEVMYLLSESDPDRARHLQIHLARIGSSVLVVGGPDQWRVHVHLDRPETALEAGSIAGHLEDVSVTALPDPAHDAAGEDHGSSEQTEPSEPPTRTGAVACAPSPPLSRLFDAVGAAVVHSAPGSRASTGELLSAIRAVGAPEVVLLPNDPDTVLAAHAAARVAADDGVQVAVIATETVVQGLSAMAVWGAAEPLAQNEPAMREAARGTRYGSVTLAGRDAQTDAGPCRVGQYLSLVGRQIVAVSDNPRAAVATVLDELIEPASEILTVVRGRHAVRSGLDRELARRIEANPDLEIVPVDGEQEMDLWLFGIE